MNRKRLALIIVVALSFSVFTGSLSIAKASSPPTEFRIELGTHVSIELKRVEDVDLNSDGIGDFRIIEAIDIWDFTGTVEGTATLDIYLVGKIPNGPLSISGSFEITASEDTVQIGGRFSMRQTGWDPRFSMARGTFFGYGDMKVRGRISVGYDTDAMVWEGVCW